MTDESSELNAVEASENKTPKRKEGKPESAGWWLVVAFFILLFLNPNVDKHRKAIEEEITARLATTTLGSLSNSFGFTSATIQNAKLNYNNYWLCSTTIGADGKCGTIGVCGYVWTTF